MTQSLKIKAEKEIIRLKRLLSECENLELSPIGEAQYNYEFTALRGNEKVKILVYFGKRGVKTVLQGNPDSNLYKKINEMITGDVFLFPEDEIVEPEKYIGSDESGKGDFFGPLSVAAFYCDKEIAEELKKLGVRDSKELVDTKILELANLIRKRFPENFSIYTIEPKEYNAKYEEFGGNLNKLLIYAHSKVVGELLKKFKVRTVITDKFSNRNLLMVNDVEFANVKFIQETKAEKYPAVAAASILARSEIIKWFDNLNARLYEKTGIKLPKGASREVDAVAQKLADLYSKEDLKRICKTHFKNFSKIR